MKLEPSERFKLLLQKKEEGEDRNPEREKMEGLREGRDDEGEEGISSPPLYGNDPGPGVNIPARPKAYYRYRLMGIVVHIGHADSGHYYSYIRDRSFPYEQWYVLIKCFVLSFIR
jgi:hypothetical protein